MRINPAMLADRKQGFIVMYYIKALINLCGKSVFGWKCMYNKPAVLADRKRGFLVIRSSKLSIA
jgi:hypothetical protein